MKSSFPFTAIIGQKRVKTALQLMCIDPKIGGLLLSGPRGSAKSTIVRSLVGLNRDQPFVTLPLGASEEMVTGSFDLGKALKDSNLAFKPGLLAKANTGILYVDEVNLLSDHLVDVLLDCAASGVNLVERDGISHEHQAEFSLIGTMNPDEGELRPQLLDRFGLMAEVQTEFNAKQRQQVVQQRLAFDRDPQSFVKKSQVQLNKLESNLDWARKNIAFVAVSETIREQIAQRCANANVEGFRADITLYRASCANAALQQRLEVTEADLNAIEDFVLDHRRQSSLGKPPSNPSSNPPPQDRDLANTHDKAEAKSGQHNRGSSSSIQGSWGSMESVATDTIESHRLLSPNFDKLDLKQVNASNLSGTDCKGNSVSQRLFGEEVKFAAPKIDWRRSLGKIPNFHSLDLMKKLENLCLRYPKTAATNLSLVLLDTSASTLSGQGLGQAKGVLKSLSREAYLKRQQLCILTFGNNRVTTLLHPQRSPKSIDSLLDNIKAGGGTPIRKALDFADNLLKCQRAQHFNNQIFLVTDGRLDPSASHHSLLLDNTVTVVDIESSRVKLRLGQQLAKLISAQYCHVSNLPLVEV